MVLQVSNMDDKQSLQCDWLSDVLKNDLLITEKELWDEFDKPEYSFLRNLLNDTVVSDKYELEEIQRGDSDVFDTTSLSADVDNLAESAELTEQSDMQEAHIENDTMVKLPRLAEKGNKRGRLHCQISRTNSVSDRSFPDDFADNLLKTPAGFYDRSCSPSCLSIPPLFDYSSSPFSYPCHISDGSCSSSFGSANSSTLCSIMEDEKWSEGSEISSIDIDASSSSALSPVDFPEDVMLSMSEDEEKEEERVVLSVVHNVLSDEAVALSLDDTVKDESCCGKHQNSSEVPSSETPIVAESRPLPSSSTTDLSRLNPLAQPFRIVPKMPVQPMPIVITPSMPTIVVPVKFAYTRLVPVATNKSATSKHPEKKVHRNNMPVLSSNALNGMYFVFVSNNKWQSNLAKAAKANNSNWHFSGAFGSENLGLAFFRGI